MAPQFTPNKIKNKQNKQKPQHKPRNQKKKRKRPLILQRRTALQPGRGSSRPSHVDLLGPFENPTKPSKVPGCLRETHAPIQLNQKHSKTIHKHTKLPKNSDKKQLQRLIKTKNNNPKKTGKNNFNSYPKNKKQKQKQ